MNDRAAGGPSPDAGHSFSPARQYAPVGALHPLTSQAGNDLIILPRSQPYRIGRDGICELQLYDVRVSRRHAQIEFQAGLYVLSDLNSSNGVYVNGNRLRSRTALRHGDTIEIGGFGGVIFRFELSDQG